ncbi:MAG: HIT family protein [Thermoflavifilum sp.]|nr:HIT family protein [Thermoflavifilum sp.]
MKTAHFAAIYNLSPIVPGHSLVIPIAHVESLFALSEPDFQEMMLFSRKVMRFLCDYFHTDAFDWAIQEKPPAGQSVAHLHVHLIPRYEHDLPEPGAWYHRMVEQEKQQIDTFARQRLSIPRLQEITYKLKEAATSYFSHHPNI